VPPATNILLITIDTLRADRVGKGLTPALDALAKEGVTFTEARSVVPLTLPAHASILSGQLPAAHGARLNGVPVNGNRPAKVFVSFDGKFLGAVPKDLGLRLDAWRRAREAQ